MRFLAVSIAAVLVLLAARPVLPACGDRPGDAGAVAATRAAAEARCDCAAATSHDGYVQCVGRVASDAVRNGQLRLRCRRAVVSCARRSTCGRPGAVTCCGGAGQCAITSAAACTAPGGSACAGDQPSCCDACAGGCAPGKTTTTTTLPPSSCQTDKDCDDGNGCSADRCVDGACQHECLCVGPTGSVTCCPGPAAECPSPTWYYTCGDPVCGGHRDHPGVPPCSAGETPGAACSPEGATCDPGSDCNQLLVCATSDPTHGGRCPISRRPRPPGFRPGRDWCYQGAGGVARRTGRPDAAGGADRGAHRVRVGRRVLAHRRTLLVRGPPPGALRLRGARHPRPRRPARQPDALGRPPCGRSRPRARLRCGHQHPPLRLHL